MSSDREQTNTTVEPWRKAGPSHNSWNLDLAKFAKLVEDHPALWLRDARLKYLNVRIDTRDGGFILADRDNQTIDVDRVVSSAIASEALS